ncbi:MAG TPA: acyl-CoA dehydrogenase family protein [Acidimicrobiales bacterium]
MSDDLAELHDELRSVARDLLARQGDGAASTNPSAVDWALLADAGWLGLEVPERLGGAGASFAEVGVVLEELGRAVTLSPYLGTVVLGVGALLAVEPRDATDHLLRRVAAGDALLAVALVDGAVEPVADTTPFALTTMSGGLRLDGRADLVPDVSRSTLLLVLASDPGGDPVLVEIAPDGEGVTVTEEVVLDTTRHLGSVVADGAAVGPDAVLRLAGDPQTAAARLLDRAALAVAFDSLGVARAMLDATVEYVKVRHQFGRAIGSFQAIKHACADLLVEVTVADELVRQATDAVVAGDPEAGTAVSMAKARTSDLGVAVAGEALQLHGGIGYTWESGIHAYLKRAALDRSMFGSPVAHRRRIATRYRPDGPVGSPDTQGGHHV